MHWLGKTALVLLSPILLPVGLLVLVVANCFPVLCTRFVVQNIPGASWQQGDVEPEKWQRAHSEAPEVVMPDIGWLIRHDFRGSSMDMDAGPFRPLRIVSYNIFLGQNLQGLIAELGALNPTPDVILLQEDNVYEDRTGGLPVLRHAGGAIAKALRMACIFTPAYFRGQPLHGCYGTSILSRFALQNPQALRCHVRPRLVEAMGDWLYGWRHLPYAEVTVPGWGKPLALASVHLPSVGLFREKLAMFDVLLGQVRVLGAGKAMVVAGDMNTMPLPVRYLPWGSRDLVRTLRGEPTLFRDMVTATEFRDPFADADGTYKMGGKLLKLDWVLLQSSDFVVVNAQVQPPPPEVGDPPSDHRWVMVDVAAPAS